MNCSQGSFAAFIRFGVRDAMVLATLTAVLLISGCGHSDNAPAVQVVRGVKLVSPGPIAVAGAHVWVANGSDGPTDATFVTELDAKAGTQVRVLAALKYHFQSPTGFAVAGGHLWVADGGGGPAEVTELDAKSGALLRVVWLSRDCCANAIALSGNHVWVGIVQVEELDARTGNVIRTVYGGGGTESSPQGIAVAAGHVWVTDGSVGTVTELSATTGRSVGVLSAAKYALFGPGPMVADGTRVWVADPNQLTVLDAKTGSLVRVITNLSYTPTAIAVAGRNVWVAGRVGMDSGKVTEFNAVSGDVERQLSASKYRLDWPEGIAVASGHVWVTNSRANLVTELSAKTGVLQRLIKGA